MSASTVMSVLARSLLAGEQTVDEVHRRAARTLGHPWRWLGPLSRRYIDTFAAGIPIRPRHREVVRFLIDDRGLDAALRKYGHRVAIAEWLAEPQRMQPTEKAKNWNLPIIESVGDLAKWLSVDVANLEWFADLKRLGHKLGAPKLQHYSYRVLLKRSGGVRLVEGPKTRLKELQRRILSEVLERIPVHPAAHGFIKGRSVLSFAAPHFSKSVLLRLDLKDFFPTSPAARVQAFFRTIGYPEQVSDLLGGLCTNSAPTDIWRVCPVEISREDWYDARILYARRHLPQGAPTSPALANLTAFRLDCRLTGLAKSVKATYTRYADDLAFSGGDEFNRSVERFSAHAASIALEEGFSVNHRKTRILRQGVRQHLAGITVNQKPNVPRQDMKLLEAILMNCVRHGPGSQNQAGLPQFRAHLAGRVSYVEMVNPARGEWLRQLFRAIDWKA
jgi:RNA-directed DNA polymerase